MNRNNLANKSNTHLSNNISIDVYYSKCCFVSKSNYPIFIIPHSNSTSYISHEHSAILFDLKPRLLLVYARTAPSITIPTSKS